MEELNELGSLATEDDLDTLSLANPSDWDEVHSLLLTFPELFDPDALPELSNAVAQRAMASGHLSIQHAHDWHAFTPAFGAMASDKAKYPPDSYLEASTLRASVAQAGARISPQASAPINNRLKKWPVKDQGSRGTCVSFAMAACAEIHFQQMDLSEQFLFWAIKAHHDPLPKMDGTRIHYAQSALAAKGICRSQNCRYSPTPIPAQHFQGGRRPSPAAIRDATKRVVKGNVHGPGPGTANAIYGRLQKGCPICIALPVFRSTSRLGGNNWTSVVGQARGRVLDPPPGSTAGNGHAVCVTGFVPDPAEALGGYFVIRNSWGSTWGRLGNSTDPRNPEPGYGSVSATYVDKFTWEWLNL